MYSQAQQPSVQQAPPTQSINSAQDLYQSQYQQFMNTNQGNPALQGQEDSINQL
jgi:hypothetical protein